MGPEHFYTLLPDFHFHWHKESLTTQVLHEQIKYCFIEIFFFHPYSKSQLWQQ